MNTLLVAVAATFVVGTGYAAHTGSGATSTLKTHHQEQSADLTEKCKQMKADMQTYKFNQTEMDSKLDGLITTMDSATGDDRITAMSAVIKELVSQRATMRTMRSKMDAKMMAHMMDHMRMPMKSGLMDCPMSKGSTTE